MDFDWDRDALDAEIAYSAAERGMVSGLEPRRWVARFAGGTAFAAPEALWERATAGAADAPYQLTRRRWAYAVLEQDRLVRTRAALTLAWNEERHPVPEPEAGLYTLAELRAKALGDEARSASWLRAFSIASSAVGEHFTRFCEERVELAETLGVDLLELDGVGSELYELAERWLERTDGLHRELGLDESRWLRTALARGATEGWPGHLSWRSVADLLGAHAWTGAARMGLPEPPAVFGASSFVRAFRAWGMAWADAQLARAKPFMAWRDPTRIAERTRGSLLALLPLNREFMRRRQGLSRQRVRDQRRHLARALLLDSRWAALRTLLRRYTSDGAIRRSKNGILPEVPELFARVLGFALARTEPGALPRLSPLDVHDFVAIFVASVQCAELVEQYDEDWFWNPRCSEVLRETIPGENGRSVKGERESGTDTLYRMLEEALE